MSAGDDYAMWVDEVHRVFASQYSGNIRRQPPKAETAPENVSQHATNSTGRSALSSSSGNQSAAMLEETQQMTSHITRNGDWTQWSSDDVPHQSGSALPSHSLHTSDEKGTEANGGWFPWCFYSQMLTALEKHHSVSNPNTPRGSPTRATHALTTQLETYNRKLRSAASKEVALHTMLFDSVESRAHDCATELRDMIAYLKNFNQATEFAKKQLGVSRALSTAPHA